LLHYSRTATTSLFYFFAGEQIPSAVLVIKDQE
jgi:hypothetical protein